MASRKDTAPSAGVAGEPSDTRSIPASDDRGDNSASELVEAPLKPGRNVLDPHDFREGGGGGAEAFRRAPRPAPR